MGRTKKTELAITNREDKLFQALYKTHKITPELAYQYLGINEKRLNRLVKEGYLERNTSITHNTSYYIMTDLAKQHARDHNPNIHYAYKGTSLLHDIELTKFYFKLTPQQQAEAMTDTDMQHKYDNKFLIGLPDMFVPKVKITIEEEQIELPNIAFEVITANYSQEKIQQKADYVDRLSRSVLKEEIVYETIRAR